MFCSNDQSVSTSPLPRSIVKDVPGLFAFSEKQQHHADHIDYHQGPCIRRLLIGCRGLFSFRAAPHKLAASIQPEILRWKKTVFAGILCVWQEKNEFPTQKIGCRLSTHLWGTVPRKGVVSNESKNPQTALCPAAGICPGHRSPAQRSGGQ